MYIENERIYIIGIDKEKGENGTMYYSTGGKQKSAKMYYRPVQSWNDYFSNKYGLWFTARYNGHKKRVYICNLPEYR